VDESIDWSIGTTDFGTDVASGDATLSNSFVEENSDSYDIYMNTAVGLDVLLAPGTYWLTLSGSVSSAGSDPEFWDVNYGPSTAYFSGAGEGSSEAFDINGDPVVPEPSSLALLGCGILVLAGALRRKTG